MPKIERKIKMTKYMKYRNEYKKTIREAVLKNPQHDFIVREDVWITFKWFEDNKIEPWEKDKVSKALLKLAEEQEHELLDTIDKGMTIILNATKEEFLG